MLARCNAAEGAQVSTLPSRRNPQTYPHWAPPSRYVFNFEKTGGCFLVFKKFFVTDEPYEVGPKGKLATFENGPASRLLASIEERLASFVLRRTRGAHSGSGG